MATNPMQRKARNSFLLGFMVMLIIAAIIIAFLIMQIINFKQAEQEKQANSRLVQVLTRDIKSGETITTADLTTIEVENMASPTDYNITVTGETIAKIDLKAGTILGSSMITETSETVTADLRLQEYNMLALPVRIEAGDYIDIRFTMPSGTDYIVISKKRVVDISENTIWLQLTEDEILTMSNAIYEAYMMPTSKLYVNLYVEPGIQANATPTYLPNQSVINLINSNPNVLATAKRALEDKLNRYTSQRNDVIQNELNDHQADANSNVEAKIQEENEKRQQERLEYLEGLSGTVSP